MKKWYIIALVGDDADYTIDDFDDVISFDTEEQAKHFFEKYHLDLPY